MQAQPRQQQLVAGVLLLWEWLEQCQFRLAMRA
jgi:hypothetical protein